jgi:hypothetical protein
LEAKRRELISQKAQTAAVLEELQTGARTEDIAAARAQVREIEEQLKLEHLKRSRRKYLYDDPVIVDGIQRIVPGQMVHLADF